MISAPQRRSCELPATGVPTTGWHAAIATRSRAGPPDDAARSSSSRHQLGTATLEPRGSLAKLLDAAHVSPVVNVQLSDQLLP